MASTPIASRNSNEIQPYRMHVSQQYIDLTQRKLSLIRLPREPPLSRRTTSQLGVSKRHIEPLIDHWLGEYDWRVREKIYNESLPQFRVIVKDIRLHFVHQKSTSHNAVPLLFIHGWPESFISASKVINALCDPVRTPPRGNDDIQAFHVVAPSLPGFGFSDVVEEERNDPQSTADILDALMLRLGYFVYYAAGTGMGFTICRLLALRHGDSCIGIHTTNPPVPPPPPPSQRLPTTQEELSVSDLSLQPNTPSPSSMPRRIGRPQARPQTDAYALCDSPSGLLAHIVDRVRPPAADLDHSPNVSPFSHLEDPWPSDALLDWTMLYWLPGPEVALRWLVNASALEPLLWTSYSNVPLSITMYRDPEETSPTIQARPRWADAYHHVVAVKWRNGKVRFPAWERPDEFVEDVREMARTLGSPPSFSEAEMVMQ